MNYLIKVGVDIVEIKRIKRSISKERFLNRIFSKREYDDFKKRKFKAESIAANFCAKEAFLKSIGKGLGFMSLNKIELLRKESGEPYLIISDEEVLYKYFKNVNFSVSVSHTKEYAIATVIAEF